jgi:glutamyl-tRNA synthetase
VKRFLLADGCDPDHGPPLDQVVGLLKERVNTLEELADAAVYFFRRLTPPEALRTQHYLSESRPALEALLARLQDISWTKAEISAALKSVTEAHKLKMPKVAMPLRVMVTGETHTPSIDATLELIGRDEVIARMRQELARFPS